MRYKVTITELTPRGLATDKDGNSTRLWNVTNEATHHVNAKNKQEAEEKIGKKLDQQIKDDCVYVMDVVSDAKEKDEKKDVREEPVLEKPVAVPTKRKPKKAAKAEARAGTITVTGGEAGEMVFENAKEAAAHYKVSSGSISHALKRGTPSDKGTLKGLTFTKN